MSNISDQQLLEYGYPIMPKSYHGENAKSEKRSVWYDKIISKIGMSRLDIIDRFSDMGTDLTALEKYCHKNKIKIANLEIINKFISDKKKDIKTDIKTDIKKKKNKVIKIPEHLVGMVNDDADESDDESDCELIVEKKPTPKNNYGNNYLNRKFNLMVSDDTTKKWEYIREYETTDKPTTNIFNPYEGCFNLTDKDTITKLFTELNEDYKMGNINHFAEKQKEISGIMLDFDCYHDTCEIQIEGRHINALIDVISLAILKLVEFDDFDLFHILITRKPMVNNDGKYELNYSEKHKKFKDGFHLLIPDVRLKKDEKKFLNHLVMKNIKQCGVFKDCLFSNTATDEILDMASSYVPTFLIGSIKPNKNNSKPHKPEFLYKIETDHDEGEKIDKALIPLAKMEKFNMLAEFSVNDWGIEQKIKKRDNKFNDAGTDMLEAWKKDLLDRENLMKTENDKYKPTDKELDNVYLKPTEFINILKLIVENLSVERAIDTQKWSNVLSVLTNIKNVYKLNDSTILNILNDFSLRGGSKYIGSIDVLSQKLESVKCFGYMSLLWHWLYHDSPTAFKKLKKMYDYNFPLVEFEYYRDYKKFINKTVTLDTIKQWADASLIYIDNGGKSYIMTKNIKYDIKTNESTIYYETVKTKIFIANMDVTVFIENPEYDANEKKDKKKNKKHLYTNLCPIVQMMISKRQIPDFNNADFHPYYKNKPSIIDTFNLFTEYEMIKYKPTVAYDYTKSKFQEHIKKYLCADDNVVFDYVENWIARLIQYPDLIGETALIFMSEQGIGKDMLKKFIALMIGSQYVLGFGNIADYFKAFNTEQMGRLLIVLNEISEKGDAFQKHNQLKDNITSSTLRIEPKGIDAYIVNKMAHYMGFTNNWNCLFVENSDRRLVMIMCNSEVANNKAHFDVLWKLMSDRDFIKSAFEYYANKDLSNFDVRAIPTTEYKKQQKLTNLSSVIAYIKELVENDDIQDKTSIINNDKLSCSTNMLYESYVKHCEDCNFRVLNKKTFKEHLAKIQVVEKAIKIKVEYTDKWKSSRGYRISVTDLEKNFGLYLKQSDFKFDILDDDDENDDE